ncbi:hypothetical protein CANARDRAFT_101740 [[Candida] arabinofermentans NRRL YB-2248]|uniref:CNH domain-containing protein n=1 Tax=[Candida] arabinofermentans NRRL YB-2248 TaxID=983967 RepID=A0A1E4SUH4_9ASCO|nr:hypothetical protein CANARDRAFT_101740 [[Candida] arabinofermentans NRRL YB-2248]
MALPPLPSKPSSDELSRHSSRLTYRSSYTPTPPSPSKSSPSPTRQTPILPPIPKFASSTASSIYSNPYQLKGTSKDNWDITSSISSINDDSSSIYSSIHSKFDSSSIYSSRHDSLQTINTKNNSTSTLQSYKTSNNDMTIPISKPLEIKSSLTPIIPIIPMQSTKSTLNDLMSLNSDHQAPKIPDLISLNSDHQVPKIPDLLTDQPSDFESESDSDTDTDTDAPIIPDLESDSDTEAPTIPNFDTSDVSSIELPTNEDVKQKPIIKKSSFEKIYPLEPLKFSKNYSIDQCLEHLKLPIYNCLHQQTFQLYSTKPSRKKKDIFIFETCMVIVTTKLTSTKVKIIPLDHLLITIFINDITKNNIIELIDGRLTNSKLYFQSQSLDKFLVKLSPVYLKRQNQSKISDYQIELLSNGSFYFDYIKSINRLFVNDHPISKLMKNNDKEIITRHLGTLEAAMFITYNSESFWILGGRSGLFMSTTKTTSLKTEDWVRVASLFNIIQIIPVGNLLIVLDSEGNINCFQLENLIKIFKADRSFQKSITFYNLLEGCSLIRAQNHTLYALMKNTIAVLQPCYENDQISTFIVSFEIPFDLIVNNFKILNNTLILITDTSFQIMKLNYDDGITCTVNFGFGLHKFPPFSDITSSLIEGAKPIDLIELSDDLLLLAYESKILISDRFGNLRNFKLDLGWNILQVAYNLETHCLILTNCNVVEVWKVEVGSDSIEFNKLETYLSRNVKLLCTTSPIVRISTPTQSTLPNTPEKPPLINQSSSNAVTSHIANAQPQTLLLF